MESGMTWTSWGSVLASFMFMAAFAKDYLPFSPQGLLMKVLHRLFDVLYPYAEIRIDEMGQERWYLTTTKIFELITVYLAANTSKSARKMRANLDNDTENLKLSMDEHQQITDEFQGITVWWSSHTTSYRSSYDREAEERRHYVLTYNKRYRDLIVNSYLKHVFEEAKAIEVKNRRRKLFTNTPSRDNEYSFSSKKKAWSPVTFDHPSSFHTLAMDHGKKADILKDLDFFKNGKDYYRKIGKTWKRGYLLYGPPGTGKSTLIAAIAKHMDYDVYDLELTAVKNNTDLRKLLIETSSKSIIVIEDIDCSADLTADRKKKKKKTSEEGSSETQGQKQRGRESPEEESKVTLSGLLNFIDGLWSSCGEERLIIFTTNHIEKLDPALIRTGRMDKHIEMSYCTYEGFTVLAQNFLDLESHPLFDVVRELIEIERVEVTPADVAEKLMPRTMHEKHSKTPCLEKVIAFMKNAKEEKMKKQNDGEPQDSTDQEDGGLALSEGSD